MCGQSLDVFPTTASRAHPANRYKYKSSSSSNNSRLVVSFLSLLLKNKIILWQIEATATAATFVSKLRIEMFSMHEMIRGCIVCAEHVERFVALLANRARKTYRSCDLVYFSIYKERWTVERDVFTAAAAACSEDGRCSQQTPALSVLIVSNLRPDRDENRKQCSTSQPSVRLYS